MSYFLFLFFFVVKNSLLSDNQWGIVRINSASSVGNSNEYEFDASARISRRGAMGYFAFKDTVFIYGGSVVDVDTGSHFPNAELWEYNATLKEWRLWYGNISAEEYISPSAANPGGKEFSSLLYHRNSDLLYVFGGTKDYYNFFDANYQDMYSFNFDSKTFTHLSGTLSANPSGANVSTDFNAGNLPIGRWGSAFFGSYNPNYLYLFGGMSVVSIVQKDFNDIWIFRVADSLWKCIGKCNVENDLGDYSQAGYTPQSWPRARSGAAFWEVDSDRIFMYGGRISNPDAFLSDLWAFDTSIDQWKLISGTAATGVAATYSDSDWGFFGDYTIGFLGYSYYFNHEDDPDRLYLFGGLKEDTVVTSMMYVYSISLGQWMVMGGNDANTVAESATSPYDTGSRFGGAAAWDYINDQPVIIAGAVRSRDDVATSSIYRFINDTSCSNLGRRDASVCGGHGDCLYFNFCNCSSGYIGDNCDDWQCNGISKDETVTVCSGHGTCDSPDQCACDDDYEGSFCSTKKKDDENFFKQVGEFFEETYIWWSIGAGTVVIVVLLVLIIIICCCVCLVIIGFMMVPLFVGGKGKSGGKGKGKKRGDESSGTDDFDMELSGINFG